MSKNNVDEGSEWIFCKDIEGKCSGINPKTKVLDKIPKKIIVHGEEIKGWMVKIVQEESEGHLNLDLSKRSDE